MEDDSERSAAQRWLRLPLALRRPKYRLAYAVIWTHYIYSNLRNYS